MSSVKTRRRVEIGVDEAAELLGVGERMVRLYIDEKRIKGLKVGRKWFIDLASVEAFRQARSVDAEPGPPSPVGGLSEVLSEVAEAAPKGSQKRRDPRQLAPFRLFNQWISRESPNLVCQDGEFLTRLNALRSEVLSEMGAGYFSFGPDKIFHYRRARGSIGGILGLIYSRKDDEISAFHPDDLEQKVLPALSSLLRAMEKKNSRSGKNPKSTGNE
jgi:excisionase family DNA binding protein